MKLILLIIISFHPDGNPLFHPDGESLIPPERESLIPPLRISDISHPAPLSPDGRGGRFNFPGQTCPDPSVTPIWSVCLTCPRSPHLALGFVPPNLQAFLAFCLGSQGCKVYPWGLILRVWIKWLRGWQTKRPAMAPENGHRTDA